MPYWLSAYNKITIQTIQNFGVHIFANFHSNYGEPAVRKVAFAVFL